MSNITFLPQTKLTVLNTLLIINLANKTNCYSNIIYHIICYMRAIKLLNTSQVQMRQLNGGSILLIGTQSYASDSMLGDIDC